jgi:putative transposase
VGRGRPFRLEWRAEDRVDRLQALYRAEKAGAVRTRRHGRWLLRTGRRLSEVAAVLGVHYRTVQQWAAWYRAGGVPAVTAPRAGGHGQPARLSPEQQAALAEQVATGRFRTVGEIRDWIAAAYGVAYKVGGVYDVLERLRCRPKVPRPLHVKADPAAQERWKRGA